MGTNREKKLLGRQKSSRYGRPNRSFLVAQQIRQDKENKEKANREL